MITTRANRKYTSVSNTFFRLAEETTQQIRKFNKFQHSDKFGVLGQSAFNCLSVIKVTYLFIRFHLQNDVSADILYVHNLTNLLQPLEASINNLEGFVLAA